MLKKISLAFIVLSSVAAGSVYWAYLEIQDYLTTPTQLSENTLVTVAAGDSSYSVLSKLEKSNIISSSFWSKFAVRLYPELTRLKAGTYQIAPDQNLLDIFQLFSSGKEHQFAVTFVEGSIFREWRQKLSELPYLTHEITDLSEAEIAKKLGVEHKKLEGLLLPETYNYVAGESDLAILKRAAGYLSETLNKVWENRNKDIPIKSSYELLILASIIEKETAVASERDQVASVFVNRLNTKMRLQTDPTVIYGIGESFNGNITKKDLRTPTSYNTYVIFGLPPTPIAMVGKDAIVAAANPAKTPYFYFVASGHGGHVFSKTLTEHNQAVKNYLKVLRGQK